jgi:hypothetical protein
MTPTKRRPVSPAEARRMIRMRRGAVDRPRRAEVAVDEELRVCGARLAVSLVVAYSGVDG